MIQPYTDIQGQLLGSDILQRNFEAIAAEIENQKSGFRINESMKLAAYGDAETPSGVIGFSPYTFAIIPHNLGYVPQFLVYKKVLDWITPGNTVYCKLPYLISGADGASTDPALRPKVGYGIDAYADTANLYIRLTFGFITAFTVPADGMHFRYYIFTQPLNP